MLPTNIFSVTDFIKQHDHIRYCEAIIHPDGSIQYAIPSHQSILMHLAYGVDVQDESEDALDRWNEAWQKMRSEIDRRNNDVLSFLADKMNVVVVWYETQLLPKNVTQKQRFTLALLRNHKIIAE